MLSGDPGISFHRGPVRCGRPSLRGEEETAITCLLADVGVGGAGKFDSSELLAGSIEVKRKLQRLSSFEFPVADGLRIAGFVIDDPCLPAVRREIDPVDSSAQDDGPFAVEREGAVKTLLQVGRLKTLPILQLRFDKTLERC